MGRGGWGCEEGFFLSGAAEGETYQPPTPEAQLPVHMSSTEVHLAPLCLGNHFVYVKPNIDEIEGLISLEIVWRQSSWVGLVPYW